MDYFRTFIIASSAPVFLPFFYIVGNSDKLLNTQKKYSYFFYTFFFPIWFGLLNVLSLLIAERFYLSSLLRYIVIWIISSIAIFCISYSFQLYNLKGIQWINYFFFILLIYGIAWFIVHLIDLLI